MDHGAIAKTAEGFVEARKNNFPLPDYPGERPTTLAHAYAVQDASLALWNKRVGGWKVGRINAPQDAALGTNRLAGPIFADTIFESGAGPTQMPVFSRGFAAVEAEFMVCLAVPAGASQLPQTDAETIAWISDIRIGIEIASSPYSRINADGPLVTISDHGNNFGLILGPQVPREQWDNLSDIEVTLDIDGEQAGCATTAAMLDGPLGAVRFLLDNMAERAIGQQDGWWISTGAVTGVHQITPGQSAQARFGGIGCVDCIISAVP